MLSRSFLSDGAVKRGRALSIGFSLKVEFGLCAKWRPEPSATVKYQLSITQRDWMLTGAQVLIIAQLADLLDER